MLTTIKQVRQTLAQGGILAVAVAGFLAFGASPQVAHAQTLLNVSYDPTRELYEDINKAFVDYWVAQGNARLKSEPRMAGRAHRHAR
jgi:sulfate transport system substrate-binding protein